MNFKENILNLFSKYTSFLKVFFEPFNKKQQIFFILAASFLSLFIIVTRYFLYTESYVWNTNFFFVGLFFTFLYSFIVFNGIIFLIDFLRKRNFYLTISQTKEKLDIKCFFKYAFGCLLVLLIYLAAYFPGAIYSDNCEQWKSVQSFIFEDWHPVLHTLIIWLFTRIYNHYSFFIFCQMLLFSFSIGYLIATMKSWGFNKVIINLVFASVIMNQMTRNIMTCAVKDCMLAIFVVFLFTLCMNIYFSKGKWIKNNFNIVIFALCVSFVSLMRHNAVLLTFPFLFILWKVYAKDIKQIKIAVFLSLFFIFLIKGPLYSALDTQRPDNFFEESISMPMTIISDVYIKNPNAITPMTMELIKKIADEEKWHRVHVMSHYVYIRFETDACNIIKRVPLKNFVKMTLDTIKADPYNSMVAVRDITDLAWKSQGNPEGVFKIDYQGESIGYFYKELPFQKYFKFIVNVLDTAFNLPILNMLLMMTGVQMMLLMLFGLISYYRNGLAPLLYVIPTIIYNFGTMWYLCNDDYRYFYFNAVVTIPVIFILLAQQAKKE